MPKQIRGYARYTGDASRDRLVVVNKSNIPGLVGGLCMMIVLSVRLAYS